MLERSRHSHIASEVCINREVGSQSFRPEAWHLFTWTTQYCQMKTQTTLQGPYKLTKKIEVAYIQTESLNCCQRIKDSHRKLENDTGTSIAMPWLRWWSDIVRLNSPVPLQAQNKWVFWYRNAANSETCLTEAITISKEPLKGWIRIVISLSWNGNSENAGRTKFWLQFWVTRDIMGKVQGKFPRQHFRQRLNCVIVLFYAPVQVPPQSPVDLPEML